MAVGGGSGNVYGWGRNRAWAGLVLNGIVVVVGILRLGLGGGVI